MISYYSMYTQIFYIILAYFLAIGLLVFFIGRCLINYHYWQTRYYQIFLLKNKKQ